MDSCFEPDKSPDCANNPKKSQNENISYGDTMKEPLVRGLGRTPLMTRPGEMLQIQRAAGNNVVTQLIGAAHMRNTSLVVQRSNGSEGLNSKDREWLIDRITFRMGQAFTRYVDACNQHRQKLREAADAKVDVGMLLLDIALSFVSSKLSSVVSNTVASLVPTKAEYKYYKLALMGMDNSEQIVSAATAAGKEMAKSSIGQVFSHSEEEAFIEGLKHTFGVALDFTHGGLVAESDINLCVIYANYDPRVATTAYYASRVNDTLSRFMTQVSPIGEGGIEGGYIFTKSYRHLAYWVELPTGTYLALIKKYDFPPYYRFQRWITKSMAEIAIKKTMVVTGGSVEHISGSMVEGITAEDLAHP